MRPGKPSVTRTDRGKPPSTGPLKTDLPREWLTEIQSMSKDPASVLPLIALALDAYEAGDFDESRTQAEAAKAEAPRSGRIRELLGLSAYHSEHWQEAARELLTFRRLTGSLDHHHVIADCYRALGRPERAIEICDEVAKRAVNEETWTEVVIVAASALADRGDIPAGLARLNRAELRPHSVGHHHLRLWYVKADLLERSGEVREAREWWERIVSVDADFFDASRRLKTSSA